MNKNDYSLLVLILVMIFYVIAGYGIAKAAYGESEPVNITVIIKDFKFQPADVRIMKGETVTWVNQDTVRHTATGSAFDSNLMSRGQTFSHTFNEAGTFNYRCTPHPAMVGRVVVQ